MTRRLLVIAVSVLALVAASVAVARVRKTHKQPALPALPAGFVGMNLNPPFFDPAVDENKQFGVLVASGVESIRVTFSWATAQPLQSDPVDFTSTDPIVGLAARHGITVLPIPIYAPPWDEYPLPASNYYDIPIPQSVGPYAAYLKALVKRYGPHGTFWSQNPSIPKLPIREWQIWNEPNLTYFWYHPPHTSFAPSYVKLVKAAHAAIKGVDSGAKVVLAGMPGTAWRSLDQIYGVSGARSSFDMAAADAYTQTPAHVIEFLQLMRKSMNAHGDSAKPLLATETGWQSSVGSHPSDINCCQTTVAGQAKNIGALLPLLGRNWNALKLAGFYYYTWVGQEAQGEPSFNFAGLFRYSNGAFVGKPAYNAFRKGALALEGCRAKGSSAKVCAKPARG